MATGADDGVETHFQYNTAVTRVNKTVINNTYINNSFRKNVNANRTSFNGPNGVKAQPTAEQKAVAANAKKMPPTSQQLARQQVSKQGTQSSCEQWPAESRGDQVIQPEATGRAKAQKALEPQGQPEREKLETGR